MRSNYLASLYNKHRRILFSKTHRDGFDKGQEYLESVLKGILSRPSYIGLREEFFFYKKYGEELDLTVAGDVGDHTDFAGKYNNESSRFDVTTNIEYKKLRDYERFQGKGINYYVALMNKDSDELVDIFDINFPICSECGNRMFEVLLVSPNRNSRGELTYGLSDVTAILMCPYDPIFHSKNITYNIYGMTDYTTFVEELPDENEFKEVGFRKYKTYKKMIKDEPKLNALQDVKFFRKEFERNLVATGSPEYIITNPSDGDGFWGTHFYWINPIVKGYFDEVLYDNLEGVYQDA